MGLPRAIRTTRWAGMGSRARTLAVRPYLPQPCHELPPTAGSPLRSFPHRWSIPDPWHPVSRTPHPVSWMLAYQESTLPLRSPLLSCRQRLQSLKRSPRLLASQSWLPPIPNQPLLPLLRPRPTSTAAMGWMKEMPRCVAVICGSLFGSTAARPKKEKNGGKRQTCGMGACACVRVRVCVRVDGWVEWVGVWGGRWGRGGAVA
mmetsp:Transcript_6741/g.15116  ORF Transcript_6741/g.15116 Transcript_6741/m.15116 type:complete len:203 (+) Transcript_6741:1702-2310(+)